MVTTSDILKATGLRSAKTLTRWHQRGIIPTPTVGPHPSGKGKTSYWPDWVLDRCVRIVELQKDGRTLSSALFAVELERIEKIVQQAKNDPTEALDDVLVNVGDRNVPILDLFGLEVIRSAEPLLLGGETRRSLIDRLRDDRVIQTALGLLATGYNPVAVFGGERVQVVPDFVVSHRLADDPASSGAVLVVPLLPPIRTTFEKLGKAFPYEPKAMPAPKIWVPEGDNTVEYMIYPGGPVGFELIRETARVLPSSRWDAE